jgi:predicted glycosyltransferase
MEILRSGRRALIIPRVGPSAEQRMRAQLFAQQGWVETLSPDNLAPDLVADAVVGALGRGPQMRPEAQPNLRGIQNAAEQLLTPLSERALGEAILELPLRLETALPVLV